MDLDKVVDEVFMEVMGIHPSYTHSIRNVEQWDSLTHISLMLALEERLAFVIPDWQAIEMTDVKKIMEVLQNVLASRGNTN